MRGSRTKTAALVACGIVCGTTLLIGCQHGATGSVSGDVYLVMQNGDVKRGAANTVLLLGPADSVLAKRGRICRAHGDQLLAAARQGEGGLTGEALADRARVDIDTALVRFAVAFSKTGINAHYRIDQVPAGKYVLWTETTIGDNAYTWWAPIVVTGGDSVSKDLDNSTEARAALYCNHESDSLAPIFTHVADSVASAAHARDSLTRAVARQQATQRHRQNWLHCMTQARKDFGASERFEVGWGVDSALAATLDARGHITSESEVRWKNLRVLIDARYECWTRFPVDAAWASQENP